MAKPFVIRVGDLFAEFLAHTFVFFGAFAFARTVTAFAAKTFFYDSDDFFVGVKNDFHFFLENSFFIYCSTTAADFAKKVDKKIFFLSKEEESIIIVHGRTKSSTKRKNGAKNEKIT